MTDAVAPPGSPRGTAANHDVPHEDDLRDLVAAMYEAAAGTRPWHEACGLMCDAFGLWSMQMLGVFKSSGALLFSFEGGQISPQDTLRYVTEYHAINPRLALGALLQGTNWVYDHEHHDEQFVAQDRFYQEFLIPSGGRWMSVTSLIDEPEVLVYLCLHRAVGTPPFDPTFTDRVDRIRTHLERALRIHMQRQRERPISVAGYALLDVLPEGVIVIDETRLITYRNASADALLGGGGSLIDRHGFLDSRHETGSRNLAAAIHTLGLTGSIVEGTGVDRALVRLPGASGQAEQLVVLLAVRPERSMQMFGETPCALVIVHPLDTRTPLDPLIVGLAFGLTPAEAQVAAALAEGHTPEDVARMRHVSMATVRTQVTGVYAKLGVQRQADLVRKVLELPRLLDR